MESKRIWRNREICCSFTLFISNYTVFRQPIRGELERYLDSYFTAEILKGILRPNGVCLINSLSTVPVECLGKKMSIAATL